MRKERTVYFVSLDRQDWKNLKTGEERKARVLASEMYPLGIYGPIYLGSLQEDASIQTMLVRSPRIDSQRIRWSLYREPTKVIHRTLVFGRVFWLSVDGSEKRMLLSAHHKAAKQAALRSPLLREGSKVELFIQRKNEESYVLNIVGDCVAPGKIKWRKSIIEELK